MRIKLVFLLLLGILVLVLMKNKSFPIDSIGVPEKTTPITNNTHLPLSSPNSKLPVTLFSEMDSKNFQIFAITSSKDESKHDLFAKDINSGTDYLLESNYDGLVTSFHLSSTDNQKYISLTDGTFVLTETRIYSLEAQKNVYKTPTYMYEVFGYKIYFIFTAAREESGHVFYDVAFYDTTKNTTQIIYKSDNLNNYHIKKMNSGIMTILHTSVEKYSDWDINEQIKQEYIEKSF